MDARPSLRGMLLALPAPQSDADLEPLVLCGTCFLQKRCEPAGRAFHAAHEKPLLDKKRRGRGEAGKEAAVDDDADAPGDSSWKKKKREMGSKPAGALKLSALLDGENLYELLEVKETASVEQIKKQYRKMALQHHPDKQAESPDAGPKSDGLTNKDQLFIKIQEAYEVLSDPSKRRQYDSTLDFDDDVPEEVDEKLGFYGTFGPVFDRNARWSCRYPVPELGDEKTDINKVHRFYDFWLSFESWRDFSMHDEYNPDEAEFREERRWMDRQNQKVRKQHVADERRRIMSLVEAAERFDPRLRAEREEREAKKREEKERRARLRQEEEDAKRRVEEERKAKALQEQAEQEERERQEKEVRKQKQVVAKGLRQRAKKAVQAKCNLSAHELEELQEMCLALENDALEALCGRLEALPANKGEAASRTREEVASWKKERSEEQARQKAEEAKRREEQRASEPKEAASGRPWAAEEMGLLAKGLQKFPGGVGGRWGLIAQFLNTAGYPRTEKEVIERTKEMSDGQSLRSMGSQISADLTAFKSGVPAKAAAKAPAAAVAAPKASAGGAAKGQGAAAAAEPQDAASEWSAEQQKSLEAALQKHPATLDKNERWRLIAEEVPGKTKAQCVERFKHLREQLTKAKK